MRVLFDPRSLERLTYQCLGVLPPKPTLVGYIVPLSDDRFLRYFCQRLKHMWIEGRTEVITKPTWTIHPSHTSVQDVVKKICSLQTQLQKNTIIVGILVRDAVDAKKFWLSLQKHVTDKQQNHLIIVMAVPQMVEPMPGVVVLDKPVFTREHVWTWVHNLIEKQQWPTDGAQKWVDIIVEECQLGESLDPGSIYQYLEYDARNLLEESSTYEAFCHALQKL